MPLIIIPLILAALVGFSSGFISLDLSGSNSQEKPPRTITQNEDLLDWEDTTRPELKETLVIEATPSPIATPKAQVAYKQPEATPKPTNSQDSDPIINCKPNSDSPCAGQSLEIKKSECLTKGINSCCQIGNDWKLMSRSECVKAQNNKAGNTNPATGQPPPTGEASRQTLPPRYTPPSPYNQEWFDNMEKSLAKQKAELDWLSENPPVERQNPEYIRGTQQDVIYSRDNRRIEENEQRKASGVIPGYEPIKQDVIYGR